MIQKSQIVRWLRKLGRDVDLDHPAGAINDLIRWSQEESGEFWHELMKDLGVVWSTPYEKVLDTSKGPEWADWFQGGGESDDGLSSTGIEALIVERADAKKAKNFARADEIRNQLTEAGIVLEDGAGGTTWRRG